MVPYFIIQGQEGGGIPPKASRNPQTLLQEQTFSVETQEMPPTTKNSSRSSSCKSVPSEQLQLSLSRVSTAS